MGEKITVKQIGEPVAQSEQGRITREVFQGLLENPSQGLSAVVVPTVFERMLAEAKIEWVTSSNINPENFPIAKEPAHDIEHKLIHMKKWATMDEVEDEIKNRGLLSATLAHLLLYVRKNPDKLRRFILPRDAYSIVAFGSKWRGLDGYSYSPYAYWASGGGLALGLVCREFEFPGRSPHNHRFLAYKPACQLGKPRKPVNR